MQPISKYLNDPENFILWKVDVAGQIIPNKIGERPKPKNISMIGFCFHSSYIPLLKIAPYKQADFRMAHLLYEICNPIWIDKVLTKTQGNEGMGNRIDF